jgi:site-specific recombinase XerD
MFSAVDNLKHRALLVTTYATGLRASEVIRLKLTDVDSERMAIRVEQGKGGKDRYTLLSEKLLAELRRYYLAERPQHWLFPSRIGKGTLSHRSASRIFQEAKARVGITKGGGCIPFAMRSPRTCSKPAPISTPSSACSGTAVCAPPCATSISAASA